MHSSFYSQPFSFQSQAPRGVSGLGEYSQMERNAFALRNEQIAEFNRLQTEVGRAKSHMAQENEILAASYKEGYAEGHRLGSDDAQDGYPNRSHLYIKTKWSLNTPGGVVSGYRSNLGAYTPEEERQIAGFNSFLSQYDAWVRNLPAKLQAEYDMGLIAGYNTAYQEISDSQQKNNIIDDGLRFSSPNPAPTIYAPQALTPIQPAPSAPTIQNAPQVRVMAPVTLAPKVTPYEGGALPLPFNPPPPPSSPPPPPPPVDLNTLMNDSRMDRTFEYTGLPQPSKSPEEIAIENAARAAASNQTPPAPTASATTAKPKWMWWALAGLGVVGAAGGAYYFYKRGQ